MSKMDSTKYVEGKDEVEFHEYEQEICTHIILRGETIHRIVVDDFERGRLVSRLGNEYMEDTIAEFIISLLIYERHVGKKSYLNLLNAISTHIESSRKNIDTITTGNGFKLDE